MNTKGGFREFIDSDEIKVWALEHFGRFLNNPDEEIYRKGLYIVS